ncbi:MAG: DUF1684 domain-containing protein [Salinibacter sp.]|uniref:DUF1684 domain-containing protein n=1 Tax=Salinibacter sp. TaxID=2065818 RepID=UPI002FC384DC
MRTRLLLLFCMAGLFLACGANPSSEDYEQVVVQNRVARDMEMRDKESVLPPGRREAFQGLNFYEVDPAYRYTVPLRRFETPDTVMIPESTGDLRPQQRVGEVTVPLPEGPEKLVVFRGEGDTPRGRLWIPFADSTNRHATYRGGRYVDLMSTDSDSVVVDFNRSYNPTCAYNPDFACPLPPPQNRVAVPVPAGEKQPSFGG